MKPLSSSSSSPQRFHPHTQLINHTINTFRYKKEKQLERFKQLKQTYSANNSSSSYTPRYSFDFPQTVAITIVALIILVFLAIQQHYSSNHTNTLFHYVSSQSNSNSNNYILSSSSSPMSGCD